MAIRPSSTALILPALVLLAGSVTARQPGPLPDLGDVLTKVGERVEQYFARAQSIVCVEIVGLMPVNAVGLGRGRTVESELRLSWEPTDENPIPIEARTLRQVMKVNGHAPRKIANRSQWESWTMERWDTSIRFKPVAFQDPQETLVLPASATSYRVTRGAGTPHLRTSTQYSSYRRFITGGRVLTPQ